MHKLTIASGHSHFGDTQINLDFSFGENNNMVSRRTCLKSGAVAHNSREITKFQKIN